MSVPNILFFDQIKDTHHFLVGGKGLHLGEMWNVDFPIPPGFCITTACYDRFFERAKDNSLFQELESLDGNDLDAIYDLGERIRNYLSSLPINEDLKVEIKEAIEKINPEGNYAVRSSATAEDLPTASFAGQQDTYLNLRTSETIIEHVKACWASLYTDRAILYRIRNGIKHSEVSMSVVVQEMIDSKVSGILFTADPVSGNRNHLLIDASFGLGEALVSGLVSPDLYRVDKEKIRIIEKKINKKEIAVYGDDNGGTYTKDLPPDLQMEQALDDDKIKALAQIAEGIEKYYKIPQDIEWCIDDKEDLYITQSRAITSLYPLPNDLPRDERLHIFISFNHIQVMPEVIRPLGQSMLKLMLPIKGRKSSYVLSAGGRLYIDITDFLNIFPFSKLLPRLLENVDFKMAEAVQQIIDRSAFKENSKAQDINRRKIIRGLSPLGKKVLRNVISKRTSEKIEEVETYLDKFENDLRDIFSKPLSDEMRLKLIKEKANKIFINIFPNVMQYLGAGIISYARLNRLLKKEGIDNNLATKLLTGLEGNVTTEMGLKVGDLADLFRKRPNMVEILENKPGKEALKEVMEIGDPEIKAALKDFFSKYGMRGIGEIDITRDRYREEPAPVIQGILNNVHTFEEGEHRRRYQNLVDEANVAEKEILLQVEKSGGKRKLATCKKLIKKIRYWMPLREHGKYAIIRCFGIFKEELLEVGQNMKDKGLIEEVSDIYYLTLDELIEANKEKINYLELVKKRKEEYEQDKRRTPPRVFTSEGEIVNPVVKNISENILIGTPVSPGSVEGLAKVITDPQKGRVEKGEILIAPFTDPGWTPLFANASGLVMEVGGLMTHGAVVAREYGIPAVVGVDGATNSIKTGDRIKVNGETGQVEFLDKK